MHSSTKCLIDSAELAVFVACAIFFSVYFLSRPPFRRLWWLERLFIARQDWDKNHIAAHQPQAQAQAHQGPPTNPPQAQPRPLFQPLANNYFLSGCPGSSKSSLCFRPQSLNFSHFQTITITPQGSKIPKLGVFKAGSSSMSHYHYQHFHHHDDSSRPP